MRSTRIAGLLALLLIHAVLLPAVMHRIAPAVRTAPDQLARFASRTQSADSWEPMALAEQYAASHRGVSLYEEVFFRRQIKFQYPPTSLAFVRARSRHTLNVLSWAAVWITVIATTALFRHGTRLSGLRYAEPTRGIEAIANAAIVAALALTFYPLLRAYTLGQIQVWLDACFALFVYAWWTGRRVAAGVALGVLCLIKPPFALIAVWALVRRDFRLLAGAAGAAAAGLAVSIWLYGPASHLDYPRVLSFLGRRGEAFYANQSFNGLFNRLLGNGDSITWHEHEFPPANGVVFGLTLAASLALTALALVTPVLRRYHGTIMDLALIGVVAVAASPIAWEHHYGIVLPLLAATSPLLLANRPFGAFTAPALALTFLLTGEFVAPALLRFTGSALGVLQSHVLAGALLFVALLMRGGARASTA